jgi:hypothetical protein
VVQTRGTEDVNVGGGFGEGDEGEDLPIPKLGNNNGLRVEEKDMEKFFKTEFLSLVA